jgi:hypothetical protein
MKLIIVLVLVAFLGFSDTNTDWMMYPNPAKEYVNIHANSGTLPRFIRIYDNNGRLVLKRDIGKEQTNVRIDLSLKPGTYIVKLEDE